MLNQTKTTRHFLLAAFLLLLFTLGAKAQDKYEYAVVKLLNPSISIKAGLFISISGQPFKRIEMTKEQGLVNDPYSDYTPLLNYVQTMTESGWRVMSSFNTGDNLSFVLERKKT